MNFQKFKYIWLSGIFFLLFQIVNAQQNTDKIEIRILPESIVYGERYTLGEVAELDGYNLEIIKKLADVEIGASPLPGRSFYISKKRVKNKLSRKFRDAKIEIISPEKALISRASSKVSSDDIAAVIQEEVTKRYKEYDEVKVAIKSPLQDVFLPKGNISYNVKRIGSDQSIGGLSTWKLALLNNGEEVRKIWVRVKVDVYDEVMVVKNKVRKGEVINARDLTKKKRNISKINRYNSVDEQLVVGKAARKLLRPNEVIKTSYLEKPVLIDQGRHITLHFKSDLVNLETKVQALKNGREGEVIPVKNLESRKIVKAVVVDEKTVEVIL